MPFCVFCDAELAADFRVMRNTRCPSCDAYLHACVQCRFHEPTLHNQCLEPEAEFVRDRQKANFCEFFELAGAKAAGRGEASRSEAGKSEPRNRAGQAAGDARSSDTRASEARAKLEALFKKKPADEDDD
jgi:hypothetical protein